MFHKTRIFPKNCTRETIIFAQKLDWPIVYLPMQIALKQGFEVESIESGNVAEWACIGCSDYQHRCKNSYKPENIITIFSA